MSNKKKNLTEEEKNAMVERGRRLKEAREKAGLTQEDLAEKIGDSKAMVGYREQGRKDISLSKCKQICDVLKCDMSYILGESDFRNLSDEAISEKTGLSQDTIDILHAFPYSYFAGKSVTDDPERHDNFVALIDFLISSNPEALESLLLCLTRYAYYFQRSKEPNGYIYGILAERYMTNLIPTIKHYAKESRYEDYNVKDQRWWKIIDHEEEIKELKAAINPKRKYTGSEILDIMEQLSDLRNLPSI